MFGTIRFVGRLPLRLVLGQQIVHFATRRGGQDALIQQSYHPQRNFRAGLRNRGAADIKAAGQVRDPHCKGADRRGVDRRPMRSASHRPGRGARDQCASACPFPLATDSGSCNSSSRRYASAKLCTAASKHLFGSRQHLRADGSRIRFDGGDLERLHGTMRQSVAFRAGLACPSAPDCERGHGLLVEHAFLLRCDRTACARRHKQSCMRTRHATRTAIPRSRVHLRGTTRISE